MANDEHRLSDRGSTAEDLADGDTTDVIAPVDVRHQHVECLVRLGEWRWDVVENRLEERGHVLLLFAEVEHHVTVAAGTVNHWRIELFFRGVEFHEELEHLV